MSELLAGHLAKSEAGNTTAWCDINWVLLFDEDGTSHGDELRSSLKELPGWSRTDEDTQRRIREAAERYLTTSEPLTDEWLGTNILHRRAFAGYRAFRLLQDDDQQKLDTLLAEFWKKWSPIILAYPTSSGTVEENPHHKLVKMAYDHAQDEIIKTLRILIVKENTDSDNIFICRKLSLCWDFTLQNAVFDIAKSRTLKLSCQSDLLVTLLERKHVGTEEFILSQINSLKVAVPADRQELLSLCCMLAAHGGAHSWAAIFSIISTHEDFGKEWAIAVSNSHRWGPANLYALLSASQLGELFELVARWFPSNEDPKHDGAHWVSPRDSVGNWRNGLIANLRDRGSVDACAAIRRAIAKLPNETYLRWTLMDAEATMRRKTWKPLFPKEIIRLLRDPSVRIVESGDQLLDVIILSLKRLHQKFVGETPAAVDLWNKLPDGALRPCDENDVSNYIKRHLEADLRDRDILLKREVEIRRGEGATEGERTDIYVDAFIRGEKGMPIEIISVIIEVKCSYHGELKTAMETQLLARYLRDNRCHHGLYLVGWFECAQWDRGDTRWRKSPRWTAADAKDYFDKQAKSLSNGSTVRSFVLDAALL